MLNSKKSLKNIAKRFKKEEKPFKYSCKGLDPEQQGFPRGATEDPDMPRVPALDVPPVPVALPAPPVPALPTHLSALSAFDARGTSRSAESLITAFKVSTPASSAVPKATPVTGSTSSSRPQTSYAEETPCKGGIHPREPKTPASRTSKTSSKLDFSSLKKMPSKWKLSMTPFSAEKKSSVEKSSKQTKDQGDESTCKTKTQHTPTKQGTNKIASMWNLSRPGVYETPEKQQTSDSTATTCVTNSDRRFLTPESSYRTSSNPSAAASRRQGTSSDNSVEESPVSSWSAAFQSERSTRTYSDSTCPEGITPEMIEVAIELIYHNSLAWSIDYTTEGADLYPRAVELATYRLHQGRPLSKGDLERLCDSVNSGSTAVWDASAQKAMVQGGGSAQNGNGHKAQGRNAAPEVPQRMPMIEGVIVPKALTIRKRSEIISPTKTKQQKKPEHPAVSPTGSRQHKKTEDNKGFYRVDAGSSTTVVGRPQTPRADVTRALYEHVKLLESISASMIKDPDDTVSMTEAGLESGYF